MNLAAIIGLHASAWGSGEGPIGQDYTQTSFGNQPIPTEHPPTLKNPRRVTDDDPAQGWRRGDSKKKKRQARRDLAQILKWTENQTRPRPPVNVAQAPNATTEPWPQGIL